MLWHADLLLFQECDAALFLLVSDGKPVWLILFGKWKEVD